MIVQTGLHLKQSFSQGLLYGETFGSQERIIQKKIFLYVNAENSQISPYVCQRKCEIHLCICECCAHLYLGLMSAKDQQSKN